MREIRPFLDFKAIKGRRRNRGCPRPVPGKPRPRESNGAQGQLSLAVALVRKQEHVLCKRCEIGLVLPFRFLQEKWPTGPGETSSISLRSWSNAPPTQRRSGLMSCSPQGTVARRTLHRRRAYQVHTQNA
jgi:hypothetical protein